MKTAALLPLSRIQAVNNTIETEHVADGSLDRTPGNYAAGAGAGAGTASGAGAGAASAGGAGAFSTGGAGAGAADGAGAAGAAMPHPAAPQPELLPHELQPLLHELQLPQLEIGAQHVWHEPQLGAGALQVLHEPQLDTGAQLWHVLPQCCGAQ